MLSTKKFLIVFVLSFSLGFLLISFIAYARQTTMPSYYPSPSGSYTKVELINQGSGGPNENTSGSDFCLETSNSPATYDSAPTSGHTYINAGTIFADPTSGYLEICKGDGSVASYPGAAFNRFCTGCTPACSTGYTVMNNSSTPFPGVTSYSCVFNNNNSGTIYTAKSGCFSNYSTIASLTTAPAAPASCSSIDANAYDMGCQTITTATNTTYKRNCCFNLGPNALGVVSSCSAPSSCATCAGSCGDIVSCGETLNCGSSICPCGESCSSNNTCSWNYCAGTVEHFASGATVTLQTTITGATVTGNCSAGYYGSPTPQYLCTDSSTYGGSCSQSAFYLESGTCLIDQCQGTQVANSTLCANNNTPPLNDTTSYGAALVTVCPSQPGNCDATCNTNYFISGTTCLIDSCATLPSHSTACNSNLPNNANNEAYTIVSPCGSTPCTASCNTGYYASGNTCLVQSCATLPTHETACNSNLPNGTSVAYTLLSSSSSCPSTACYSYCSTGYADISGSCDNCTVSGSYTTAAYNGPNTTNTESGEFCTTSGSIITLLSDPCQGTNSASAGCTPTFYIQSPGSCPSSVPEYLACSDNGEPNCGGSYVPNCVANNCGEYHNQCC